MLERYEKYSRLEVHDILDPTATFAPHGVWGIWGIVPLQGARGYVLLITLGSEQAGHHFKESISEDGIMSWQSQPQNSLKSKVIKNLIHQQEQHLPIYVLIRASNKVQEYFYLGQAEYVWHDNTREKPVYFEWQLLDWSPTEEIKTLFCRPLSTLPSEVPLSLKPVMVELITPPTGHSQRGSIKRTYHNLQTTIDFRAQQDKNLDLGECGEHFVLSIEQERLRQGGRDDLAAKVTLTCEAQGNTCPYDIASFELDGTTRYIEVKTTKKSPYSSFYLSSQEYKFYKDHLTQYYLYRLCSFYPERGHVKLYIIQDLDQDCILTVSNYIVTLS